MPASNAFTGFTTNGQNGGPMNVSGAWDLGWDFNNKITSPDATVYFPASGARDSGSLFNVGDSGWDWSAVPSNNFIGCVLVINSSYVSPRNTALRTYGFPVRPVAE